MSSGAVGRVGGPVVIGVGVEGAASAALITTPAEPEGPESSARARHGFEDLVIEGASGAPPAGMGDLLDSLARGVPFELAIIELKQKLALDEARETTVSNVATAYQRIAMSVIGNLKA